MGQLKALALAVLALARAAAAGATGPTNCTAEVLARLLPAHAKVVSVVMVAAGDSYGEGAADIAYPMVPTELPALCAVTVRVASSATSSYRFALLLPAPAAWNERLLAVGNGGFAGGINWADAAVGARYGFATASTDTGHNSTVLDGSWALHDVEAQADWGWRAMHGTATLAKTLTGGYYGVPARRAYYSGCSTGGRQGLREAQLHADTFDGLLLGAPAWWTSHLQPWSTWLGAQNLPADGGHHVDPAFVAAVVAAEAVRQCDAVDGLADGIISAPDVCRFDLAALGCGALAANASACLSPAQIATLRKAYAPYLADGRVAMPGLSPGAEWQYGPVMLGGDAPSPLGVGYEQFFLLGNASWPWQLYNDSIVALADRLDPGSATADDYGALAAVRDRGSKILMYHGHTDGFIPTDSSTYLYERVAAATGGLPRLRDWFRLFLVPGMGHCGSTNVDAPWYIAGPNQAPMVSPSLHSVPGFADARHDALLALLAWVENGTVVDDIVATTWTDPHDPGSGVLRQRPLCPYPQRAGWNRVGNVAESFSWTCA